MIAFDTETSMVRAFLDVHDCVAKHVDSVYVIEGYQGDVVWEGDVEVFDLKFHPTAKRGYAWTCEGETGEEIVTVLELHPIDSPHIAVQTTILTEMRARGQKTLK